MAILASSQWNRLSLGRSIPSSGTKTSKAANHEVIGTGSKNFASAPLGLIVSDATPISTS